MAWQGNGWLGWQHYTTGSWGLTNTTNVSGWPAGSKPVAGPKPKDEAPLEWLRRRVEEVTELAA